MPKKVKNNQIVNPKTSIVSKEVQANKVSNMYQYFPLTVLVVRIKFLV